MIVACEKCRTRFQLDDARVPDSGVRVRCSRCKHAFFVTPGHASREEVTHALAGDVASQGGGRAPAATQDLSAALPSAGETLDEMSGSTRPFSDRLGAGPRAPAHSDLGSPSASGEIGAREEESDWQFNDDRPPSGAGGRSSGARPQPVAAAEPPAEDLGLPESWDFLAAGEQPGAAVAEQTGAPARPDTAAAPAADRPAAVGRSERRRAASAAAMRAPMDAARPELSRPARAAGWAASALLLAVIAGASFAPRSQPGLVLPTTWPAGRLAFDGLEARLVDNAVAGPVLVVSGWLRNPTAEPAPLGATLEVTLLGDAPGTPLPNAGAAGVAGRAVSTETLRERDAEAIRTELAASADALAWTELQPGEEIALEAVLSEVPLGASGFSVAVRPAEPPPPPPVEIAVPEPAPPPPPPPPARERRARSKRAAS